MQKILIPLLLGLWAGPCQAEATSEPCLMITDSNARLACYDAALGYQPPVSDAAPATDTGQWDVQSEVSKLDDSTNVFLTLSSDEQTNCAYKSGSHRLWIACRENKTSLWVTFGRCFMSDIQGKGRVTYRLDSTPAQKARFRESNDHMALGLWNGGSAIPFIKRLLGHDDLLIRATPFSDSTVTGEYRIKGIDAAIAPLRDACNW